MSFAQLLEQIGTLAKSQAAATDGDGDNKIAAAAGDDAAAAAAAAAADNGGATAGNTDGAASAASGAAAGAAAGAGADKGAAADDKGAMAKSMTVKLADGTEAEAIDGTELVKSLVERIETGESAVSEALTGVVGLFKSMDATIKAQGEMIKSMGAQIAALGSTGAGRKSVLLVSERKDTLAKSTAAATGAGGEQENGVTPEVFMTKALSAQQAGKLTGAEVSRAEAYLNRGLQVPAEIVAKVAAAQ